MSTHAKGCHGSKDMTLPNGKKCVECDGVLHGRQNKFDKPECATRNRRRLWLRKVYNISLEQYDVILAHQGGCCGVCHRLRRSDETFHVDHEHGGHVRGLTCAYCNTRLIGRLKSHQLAQWLADYLLNPPAVEALGEKIIAPGRPRKKRTVKRKVGRSGTHI